MSIGFMPRRKDSFYCNIINKIVEAENHETSNSDRQLLAESSVADPDDF
jgi:hypothetical protein